MKIWIDLDNSPHVPFFVPIIRELERRGHTVMLTARNAFQVCELADSYGLAYKLVGHHYGKNGFLKAYGVCVRALQLFPFMLRANPGLAVSHGSRSQLLAAAIRRIPSLLIFDYEFARHLELMGPRWVMTPEVIPTSAIPYNQCKVLRYPGIKEDVYAASFKPNPSIKDKLGLNEDSVIVTVRPPASEAHYHNPEADKLFDAVIELLSHTPSTKIVLLPRNGRQEALVRRTWPELFSAGKITIPEHAVDGLNLVWYSDLVISGGGTMNREAAALGVPVYSIFRGQIGAVDRFLAEEGRLILLESCEDVRNKIVLKKRGVTDMPNTGNKRRSALSVIVDNVVLLAGSVCN